MTFQNGGLAWSQKSCKEDDDKWFEPEWLQVQILIQANNHRVI